jgi:hypothetical protein
MKFSTTVGFAIGQQAGKEIVIEVKDTSSQPLGAPARCTNGYHSSVQWQSI